MIGISENWIDLSSVPKIKTINKEICDWRKADGCICHFYNTGVYGEIKLGKYNTKTEKIEVEYDGYTTEIIAYGLVKNNISQIVKKKKRGEFTYNIGDILDGKNGQFEILEREKRIVYKKDKFGNMRPRNKRYYRFLCKRCTYDEYWSNEDDIVQDKFGCPVCDAVAGSKKIVKGINDITITDPWMIPFFQGGAEEASHYSAHSAEKKHFLCPECGRIKNKAISINQLNRDGKISCVCGDGISYPNKFMYSFFKQLGVDYEIEKMFSWSGRIEYDDFVTLKDGETLICENHGMHHFEETCFNGNKKSLRDERKNDKYKMDLAKGNGIDYYIQLDCRYSDKNWIINSIMNSQLVELFDVSKVDFDECERFACGSILKMLCDAKNEHPDWIISDFKKELKLARGTIRRYFKIGNELGLCHYDIEKEIKKAHKRGEQSIENSKPIYCKELDKYFFGARFFIEYYEKTNGVKLSNSNIYSVCNGKYSTYKNMHFSYVSKEFFNEMKLKHPEKVVGDFFKSAKDNKEASA